MDLPALAVAIPLLAAALLAAARALLPRGIGDGLAILAAAAAAALCVIVLLRTDDRTLVYWFGAWTPRGGVAIGISFSVDQIGAGAAAFAALLAVGALVFATRYVDVADDLFQALMLVFLAGMIGFSYSGDLFNLFVFFELTLISAFVLCGYQIEQRAPLEGSLNFAIANSVGSFLFLAGIGLVYGRTGALNLAQIGEALAHRPPDALVAVAFALIAAGLLVKAAIVPFHFWLADAYAVARTPVCILLAGIMSELGLYAVARVYWSAFSGALGGAEGELRAILVALGVLTVAVGSAMALVQTHLKRLLAFVTVAYLGMFLTGIGLLSAEGLAGAALFAAGDGFVKAAAFVAIGIVQHRFAHVSEGPLHGRGRALPLAGAGFALAALAIASFPPFGSFLGKSLLEHAASQEGYDWLVPVLILGAAACGAALLRAAVRVFLGYAERAGDEGTEEGPEDAGDEAEHGLGRTPLAMALPLLAFLAAGLAVGLWPGIADATSAAAARFVDRGAYAATVLHGIPAPHPQPPPSAVPHWYDWLYGAASALAAAAAAVAIASRRGRPPVVARPLAGLRALHSGHPGDYVAFVVLGAALIAGLSALLLV